MSRIMLGVRAQRGRKASLRLPVAVVLLLFLSGGCAFRRPPVLSEAAQLQVTISDLLNEDESTPEYHEMRIRIQDMGPEVDAVLLALARDRAVNVRIRANALHLLAERGTPGTFEVLQRALAPESPERLRVAAVLGLQQLGASSPEAARLIRASVQDRSRMVRIVALTALQLSDIETMRAVYERERDRDVRPFARQLIMIAEARGAPLAVDRQGALRTTSAGLEPQLVFRPGAVEPLTGISPGQLRLELSGALDVPLSSNAEAQGGVVPAFFSADYARVVYEDSGEIKVIDIPSRNIRSVGPGIAPRVIPFSDEFVFLRESSRTPLPGGERVELRYEVYRAPFANGNATRMGDLLRAEVASNLPSNATPVRRMLIDDTPDGIVLRGEGINTYPLLLVPDGALAPASPFEVVAFRLRVFVRS